MYNIAKLSNNDRDIIFKKYSFEYSISEAIVEKRFLGNVNIRLFIS